MSLEDVALVRDVEAAPLQKLLLYALASRADRAGRCWPSVRRLCQDTGLSRRAVQIHLSVLADRRAFVREGRRGRTNVYRLTLANLINVGEHRARDHDAQGGEQLQSEVRMSCAPPAHEVRTPAHGMRTPCARHAPEVKGEVPIEGQEKPRDEATAVDNRPAQLPWWRSRDAVMQRGLELGLMPKPGEAYAVYKDRVYRASRARDE